MSSTAEAPVKASGAGLGVRVGAFLMGTGVGFGTANYIIYEELKESNLHIYAHLRKLEEEIQKKKLEARKAKGRRGRTTLSSSSSRRQAERR